MRSDIKILSWAIVALAVGMFFGSCSREKQSDRLSELERQVRSHRQDHEALKKTVDDQNLTIKGLRKQVHEAEGNRVGAR